MEKYAMLKKQVKKAAPKKKPHRIPEDNDPTGYKSKKGKAANLRRALEPSLCGLCKGGP